MRGRRFIGIVALLVPAFWGCDYKSPTTPVYGYETEDQNCSDGLDNDLDGLIDCDDSDCIYTSTHCGEQVPLIPDPQPENTFALCHDQIDNDGNGQFDCGDARCREIMENCCILEFTNERCSDGIDNDNNGFVDCDDFACSQGQFVTVCDDGPIVDPCGGDDPGTATGAMSSPSSEPEE